MTRPELLLVPCTYAEAKEAVMRWHYSRRMPRSTLVPYSVREGGRPVGCVLFGRSASKDLLTPYGLSQDEGCELLRVALGPHETPVSRVVGVALRLLRRDRPSFRLVVSFADPEHGHAGGIYQAGNWVYAGTSAVRDEYVVNGVRTHGRALRATRGTSPHRGVEAPNVAEWARRALGATVERVKGSAKHRYLYPLDEETRRRVAPLARPYPKRAASIVGDAPADQAGEGGSTPTAALSFPTEKVAV